MSRLIEPIEALHILFGPLFMRVDAKIAADALHDGMNVKQSAVGIEDDGFKIRGRLKMASRSGPSSETTALRCLLDAIAVRRISS